MPILSTDRLSKVYRATGLFRRRPIEALVDATIEVRSGEIFGLLGPNGAGKTTFCKIILSIVSATSGSAQVFEKPIGDVSIRERCGYLPENHRYPGFLTAFETMMLFGGLSGLKGTALQDKAHSLLELVGLMDWKTQKTQKFSKGMLQRLGLAQALLNDPALLFLDEPTDGVDPLGRKEMRDLFLKLRGEGVTIVLSSHLLSEVEMISDRVAILNKGKVIRSGTLDEIRGGKPSQRLEIEGSLSTDQSLALRRYAQSIESNAGVTSIDVTTDSDLNQVIDQIRSWGMQIRSIRRQVASLEDSFIRLIEEEGKK
jgi:ABC-2 type transport system ATP-binding protein